MIGKKIIGISKWNLGETIKDKREREKVGSKEMKKGIKKQTEKSERKK